MKDNIKISITGNYIWAKQTGPDSVEVGEMPGCGIYNKATHICISRESARRIQMNLPDNPEGGYSPNEKAAFAELTSALRRI